MHYIQCFPITHFSHENAKVVKLEKLQLADKHLLDQEYISRVHADWNTGQEKCSTKLQACSPVSLTFPPLSLSLSLSHAHTQHTHNAGCGQ
jgi:hypothetical protein